MTARLNESGGADERGCYPWPDAPYSPMREYLRILKIDNRLECGDFVISYDEGNSRSEGGTGEMWVLKRDDTLLSVHRTPEKAVESLLSCLS